MSVDFLHHFRLMVGLDASRLVDTQSSQELSSVSAIAGAVTDLQAATGDHHLSPTLGKIPLLTSAIPGSQRLALTAQFSGVVNLERTLPAPTTDVEHHAVTKGHPLIARLRQLDAENLAAAKGEFLQLESEAVVSQMVQQSVGLPAPYGPES